MPPASVATAPRWTDLDRPGPSNRPEPRVGERVALRERILRIAAVLPDVGDPPPARDGRDHGRLPADPRRPHDLGQEVAADNRLVVERLPSPDLSTGVHHGQPG